MAKKAKKWQPEESFGGLVVSLASLMTKRAKQLLKEAAISEVSFPRYWAMHALAAGPQSQATLCKILVQSAPSVMEMLEGLYRDQLVSFKASPTDARKKQWFLTAKGRELHQRSAGILRGMGDEFDRVFRDNKISSRDIARSKEILLMARDQFAPSTLKTPTKQLRKAKKE